MEKILIIGSGGAGKSTLARRLGEVLDLSVIHLDQHYWLPGWAEPDKAAWLMQVRELILSPKWIIDGNFGSSLDIRLQACDAVIFLDMSKWRCIWRVLKRQWIYRNRTRPDMGDGCPEKLDWEFVQWIWRFPKVDRPKILKKLANWHDQKQVLVLRSPRAVEKLLQQVQA